MIYKLTSTPSQTGPEEHKAGQSAFGEQGGGRQGFLRIPVSKPGRGLCLPSCRPSCIAAQNGKHKHPTAQFSFTSPHIAPENQNAESLRAEVSKKPSGTRRYKMYYQETWCSCGLFLCTDLLQPSSHQAALKLKMSFLSTRLGYTGLPTLAQSMRQAS